MMDALEMVKITERAAIAGSKLLEHVNWMAQTVHQAYHQEHPGHWMACPKDICRSTAKKLADVAEGVVNA